MTEIKYPAHQLCSCKQKKPEVCRDAGRDGYHLRCFNCYKRVSGKVYECREQAEESAPPKKK
jgi:hypothetical protein